MLPSALTHPTAALSRKIEDLVIYGEHASFPIKGACALLARGVSSVVFPIFLTLELVFKRIPKMLLAIRTDKFSNKLDKVVKFSLAIFPSILLGLYSPEGMPGFFLKRPLNGQEVRPFGVERIFGASLSRKIDYPTKVAEVQQIVREAAENGQQISVIGAGMSQGTQTIPKEGQRVIHTKYLNHIEVDTENNCVTVGAGATWEQVQLALDEKNKSAIVKQASDIFSIGGSIGINCHGWAHEYGAISKTVRSLKMIDAKGELRTLHRPREGVALEDLSDEEKLFKCMFGTLGYFGVIVEATLDVVDNEELIEETTEVDLDAFIHEYETQIKGKDIPLFGGRLVLDTLEGEPLRRVYMQTYRKQSASQLSPRHLQQEPRLGTRMDRIGLKLISHLPSQAVRRMIHFFWEKEKVSMFSKHKLTRNEALHPPINAFKILHRSDLHAQWLQEYFIDKERLPDFLQFLGAKLKANDVRLINATIRPTPQDNISILPYADKDRYAVVICFAQKKTNSEIQKTKQWIEDVNQYVVRKNDIFYQAYMPYATQEQFEKCYGEERVATMRALKNNLTPKTSLGMPIRQNITIRRYHEFHPSYIWFFTLLAKRPCAVPLPHCFRLG